MIAEQVWDMNFDSDTNVVEVAVKTTESQSWFTLHWKVNPYGSWYGLRSWNKILALN